MATFLRLNRPPDRPATTLEVDARSRHKPVVFWAAVGGAFLVLEAYVMGSWILSGDATPTPRGETPIPTYMVAAARGMEIFGVIAFVLFAYFFVVRPWRREGRITQDGLFCIAFTTLYWQDPLVNYYQTWFTYNTAFINLGSWVEHVPGWMSPRGRLLPEPILAFGTTYLYVLMGAVMVGNFLMQKAVVRYPRLTRVQLLALCFAFFFCFDLVVEPFIMMRWGLYTYAGSIPAVTVFHGHYYQFPLTEALFFAALFTGWCSLRFFKNDKGYTYVERGVDQLKASPRRKSAIRFLAIVGALNVIMLALYCVPGALTGLYGGPWPDDVTKRPYLTDGICGPGTDNACSGPSVPIPRPDSARLGPNGELVPARR